MQMLAKNDKLSLFRRLTRTLVALKANATENAATDCTLSCHQILLLLEIVRLLYHILKMKTFTTGVTSLPLGF